ncbi:MAG: tetratricopeptide repeat protein [Alphaproteobacteria bacterium]
MSSGRRLNPAAAARLADAMARHRAGDIAAAATAYEAILADDPGNADARHLAGVAAGQQDRHEDAVRLIEGALALAPNSPDMLANLGLSLRALGRTDDAIESFRQAINRDADNAKPWLGLARTLIAAERAQEAADAFGRAVALSASNPGLRHEWARAWLMADDARSAITALDGMGEDAETLDLRGVALQKLGRPADAIVLHERAFARAPSAQTLNNLALARRAAGDNAGAEKDFRAALARDDRHVEALSNLGDLLMDEVDNAGAESAFDRAIAIKSHDAFAMFNRANLYARTGRHAEAVAAYDALLARNPGFVDALINRGASLQSLGWYEASARSYENALTLDPSRPEAYNNLGNLHLMRCAHAEAEAAFRQALATARRARSKLAAAIHSNLLLALGYDSTQSVETLWTEHREWAVEHGRIDHRPEPHANHPDPDRVLRIGYVSPDLDSHAVAAFLNPILVAHDRDAFHIYAYAEVAAPDDTSAALRAHVDVWRSTIGLDDAQMADAIRADSIDILVDLAGHTNGNRLTALALKPAPIQASYLGYAATTAVPAIEFRIGDAFLMPEGAPEHFSERIERLAGCNFVYSPPTDAPEVAPSPAALGRGIVFGSFNAGAKLSDDTIALWSAVLVAVPQSRLVLKTKAFGDAATRARTLGRFAAHGIDAGRIELLDFSPDARSHLATYAKIDIALDTFPYGGGTTTMEALWMGVPVVSLAGDRSSARMTGSILRAAGLDAFVTDSPTGYVMRAAELAFDIERLARMRQSLRSRIAVSPLLDGPGFTRGLEGLYRRLWRDWCTKIGAAKKDIAA